eukprot:CAMPEP_0172188044 /NCGR_PEP_ID=MMETSP1050-20130122/21685_1 /TAXON_ID=233186 /ORGANISM="Cryptomonas curvata, Strain CCAP979/52" /LENGTH=129 /DNA_ID=CAMNT_0012862455 /DNA_START=252 /DNA_END=637 /DNA_ORIENTATION=-
MCLKIGVFGFGFKVPPGYEDDAQRAGYFASQWNRFDCFVVLMSWVLYVYALFGAGVTSNLARSARIIRLARPVALIRKANSHRLRKLVLSVLPLSVATFLDAALLLMFCISLYAILGLNLYGLDGVLFG